MFDVASKWLKNYPSQKFTRLQFGELLSKIWNKSTTLTNAISKFRATEIYPFNPDAVSDYIFVNCDANISPNFISKKLISPLFQVLLENEMYYLIIMNKCNVFEAITQLIP